MQYVFSGKKNLFYILSALSLAILTGCPAKVEKSFDGSGYAPNSNIKGPRQIAWLNPDRSGQNPDTNYSVDAFADRRLSDMNAMGTVDAWDEGADDCDSIKIAVIDSAIEIRHENLEDNIALGWNEVDYHVDPSPAAFHSLPSSLQHVNERDLHGTHVAGIIGSISKVRPKLDSNGNPIVQNGNIVYTGVSGICRKAQLIAIKALDGKSGTVSDVIEAIEFADQLGAQVINASWGVGAYVQSMYNAIAARPHILFVVAAGNAGVNIDNHSYSPATFSRTLPNVLTVGAAQVSDMAVSLASFSNYGVNTVGIAAPGSAILSTIPRSCKSGNCNLYYEKLSGTSMAAPFVSGVAGLIWADQPHLTATEVKNEILSRATEIQGSLSGDIHNSRFLHIGDTF